MDDEEDPTKDQLPVTGDDTGIPTLPDLPPGARVEQTSNGTIVRAANGHFLPGSRPTNVITAETARSMQTRRIEVTAARIRSELAKRTGQIDGRIIGASEAAAVAAGQMWEQIVLDDKANPRYRAETWQMIAKHAGLLGDNRQTTGNSDGITLEVGAELARALVDRLLQERNKP